MHQATFVVICTLVCILIIVVAITHAKVIRANLCYACNCCSMVVVLYFTLHHINLKWRIYHAITHRIL
jgi:hypothetical protein